MWVRFNRFVGLLVLLPLGILTIAITALSQPSQVVRLMTWMVNSTASDSVSVVARATNTGSEALRIVDEIDFQLEYRPSPWSDSILVVRRDSVLVNRGDTLVRGGELHSRCGELPGFPSLRDWWPLSVSPETVVLESGESLADTFVFAPRRTLFKDWPGRIIIKSALWIETGRSGEPFDIYSPEETWISVPVPCPAS